MSREIKFRAWDCNKKSFLSYNCYVSHKDFVTFTCFDRLFKTEEEEIVFQQFTGLKDKNGKDIYEGDIVRLRISIETKSFHISEVWSDVSGVWCVNPNPNYSNGNPRALINFIQGSSSYVSRFADCEIIGNIFENKHLL